MFMQFHYTEGSKVGDTSAQKVRFMFLCPPVSCTHALTEQYLEV